MMMLSKEVLSQIRMDIFELSELCLKLYFYTNFQNEVYIYLIINI